MDSILRHRTAHQVVYPIPNHDSQHTSAELDLISWDDLAQWRKDNESVLGFYRKQCLPLEAYGRSIFTLHNESVSIWTHGFGLIAWSYMLVAFLGSTHQSTTVVDLIAVATLLVCNILCYTFSTFLHVFNPYNESMYEITSKLDHVGIVLVIWSSTIAGICFAFLCIPSLMVFYSGIATSLAAGCCYAIFQPFFQSNTGAKIRIVFFLGLGMSGYGAIVHAITLFGLQEVTRMMKLDYMVQMCVLHTVGALTYAFQVPERWSPGRFDLFGSSHQIMHIFVLAANYTWSLGALKAFAHWQGLRMAGMTCMT